MIKQPLDNLIPQPYPHITVQSAKKIHGWFGGRRECTGERLLLNPYNGCFFNCLFCYANAFGWGYFRLFQQKKVVTVWENFDQVVAKTLDKLPVAACGYLSPVSDPFQPVNQKYRLSEKLIQVFGEHNLPIELITKGVIPQDVIAMLARQPHSFAQVSVLTPRESLRQQLVRGAGAATTEQLFDNLRRLKQQLIYGVLRIDPIIPYVTDNKSDLALILDKAAELKVDHIVASVLDLPLNIYAESVKQLYRLQPAPAQRYEDLYQETIGYARHARLDYREQLFAFLREECLKRGLSFALCMEFAKVKEAVKVPMANGQSRLVTEQGLNQKYMSGCVNCEGQNVPMYVKSADGFHFQPAVSCAGNCLNCKTAACGLPLLAMGRAADTRKDFVYRDYLKRFQN